MAELVQLAPDTTAAARPVDEGSSNTEVDSTDMAKLADEVFDRIERRLRTDMLSDLERRGEIMEWN